MKIFWLLFLTLCSPNSTAAPSDFYGDLFSAGQKPGAVRSKTEIRRYEYGYMGGLRFGLEQSRFELSVPVSISDDSSWRAMAYADYDAIESKASFPNGRLMPNRLWDIGTGVSHTRNLQTGESFGGSFFLHSPSDHPFSAGRDLGFSLNLSYKVPQEQENAWIFFLNLSNNRGFLNHWPLPGAAYFYRPNPHLRLLAGLPFLMAFWLPTEKWMVSASYFPIRSAELRVSYGNPRGLQPYGLVSYRSRNYRLFERSNSKERIFFDEGLGQLGLSSPVYRGVLFDLSGGLSFARRYYLAEKTSSRKDAPGLAADNAFFISARVQTFF